MYVGRSVYATLQKEVSAKSASLQIYEEELKEVRVDHVATEEALKDAVATMER
jgi:hypothetical protein